MRRGRCFSWLSDLSACEKVCLGVCRSPSGNTSGSGAHLPVLWDSLGDELVLLPWSRALAWAEGVQSNCGFSSKTWFPMS